MQIAVIVAIRNEEKGISKFITEVNRTFDFLETHNHSCELILVEDGSTDKTLCEIHHITEKSRISLITLIDGRSQTIALAAGMALAKNASIFVTMDADLSHPLAVVSKMINELLASSTPMVQGFKVRSDSWMPRYQLSNAFHSSILGSALGIPLKQQNTIFRAIRSDFFRNSLFPSISFWTFGRLNSREWCISHPVVIKFLSEERSHGETKYNSKRLTEFAVLGLISVMPNRMILFWGIAIISVSLLLGFPFFALCAIIGSTSLITFKAYRNFICRRAIKQIRVRQLLRAKESFLDESLTREPSKLF